MDKSNYYRNNWCTLQTWQLRRSWKNKVGGTDQFLLFTVPLMTVNPFSRTVVVICIHYIIIRTCLVALLFSPRRVHTPADKGYLMAGLFTVPETTNARGYISMHPFAGRVPGISNLISNRDMR